MGDKRLARGSIAYTSYLEKGRNTETWPYTGTGIQPQYSLEQNTKSYLHAVTKPTKPVCLNDFTYAS